MSRDESIKKIMEEGFKNVIVKKPFLKNNLDIPDYLKFGFEIEGYIDEDKIKKDMMLLVEDNYFDNDGFRGTGELIDFEENEYGGLDSCVGGEVITPILKDEESSWIDLEKACDYLRKNSYTTSMCSVHTNIGAESLGSDYKNWYNFCKIIAAFEPEIYRYMCEGKGIRNCAISGGFRSGFGMPIANLLRNGIKKSDEENVSDINTLLNNCKFNGEYTYRKDKSISLKGIYIDNNTTLDKEELDKPKYGRRIEFRMANGTFNERTIQNQLYIISKIIELSRNLTKEQEKLLDEIIKEPLPTNYNSPLNPNRVIDFADLLFNNIEDKLQFIYTTLDLTKKEQILNNKDKILKLIKSKNMVLEYLSDEFKNDKEIVLEAVKIGGHQLKYASDNLKNDKDVVLTAVKKYGRALEEASTALRNDKEVVLEAIKNDALALKYASETLKKDKDVIALAIKNNKESAKYLGKELLLNKQFLLFLYKDDQEVKNLILNNKVENEKSFIEERKFNPILYSYLLNCIKEGNNDVGKITLNILNELKNKIENKRTTDYISIDRYRIFSKETFEVIRNANNMNLLLNLLEIEPTFFKLLTNKEKNNKVIALKILEMNSSYFKDLSKELRSDKEVVLKAVESNGSLLYHASELLKDDRDVVLAAIKNYGSNIRDASERLKDDKELAILAVEKEAYAIFSLSNRLQEDLDVVEVALKKNIDVFRDLSEKIRGNKEIALELVKNKAYIVEALTEDLKNDIDIANAAIESNENAYKYFGEKIRYNRNITIKCVRKNGDLLKYTSDILKDDIEVVLEAINNSASAIGYASDKIKDNKDIILYVVKQNGFSLRFASERLRDDKEVVLEAVKNNGYVITFASERLKNDIDVVLEAISKNKTNLQHIGEEIKNHPKILEFKKQIKK